MKEIDRSLAKPKILFQKPAKQTNGSSANHSFLLPLSVRTVQKSPIRQVNQIAKDIEPKMSLEDFIRINSKRKEILESTAEEMPKLTMPRAQRFEPRLAPINEETPARGQVDVSASMPPTQEGKKPSWHGGSHSSRTKFVSKSLLLNKGISSGIVEHREKPGSFVAKSGVEFESKVRKSNTNGYRSRNRTASVDLIKSRIVKRVKTEDGTESETGVGYGGRKVFNFLAFQQLYRLEEFAFSFVELASAEEPLNELSKTYIDFAAKVDASGLQDLMRPSQKENFKFNLLLQNLSFFLCVVSDTRSESFQAFSKSIASHLYSNSRFFLVDSLKFAKFDHNSSAPKRDLASLGLREIQDSTSLIARIWHLIYTYLARIDRSRALSVQKFFDLLGEFTINEASKLLADIFQRPSLLERTSLESLRKPASLPSIDPSKLVLFLDLSQLVAVDERRDFENFREFLNECATKFTLISYVNAEMRDAERVMHELDRENALFSVSFFGFDLRLNEHNKPSLEKLILDPRKTLVITPDEELALTMKDNSLVVGSWIHYGRLIWSERLAEVLSRFAKSSSSDLRALISKFKSEMIENLRKGCIRI